MFFHFYHIFEDYGRIRIQGAEAKGAEAKKLKPKELKPKEMKSKVMKSKVWDHGTVVGRRLTCLFFMYFLTDCLFVCV